MKRFLVLSTVSTIFLMCIVLFNRPALCLMVHIPLSRLVQESDAIVIGEVVDKESRQGPDICISTYVTIQIEQTLKGTLQETVLVEIPGGKVRDICLMVSDTPEFEKDEQALVFLKQKKPGVYIVRGLFQGKFTIKNGIILENNQDLEDFVREIREIG